MKALGRLLIYLIIYLLGTTACSPNMRHQARIEPYEASEFFADNLSARPLPANTVPYGRPVAREGFLTGRTADGNLLETVPLSVTKELIQRGQVQYDIYCSPCHGQTGRGEGIIVQRGFPAPPSFQSDSLQQAPAGHYFEVISQGFGRMYSYADHISPEDRWAITTYIRSELPGQSPP